MTANQRRPGFRLPWSAEGSMDDSTPGRDETVVAPPASAEPVSSQSSDASAPTKDAPPRNESGEHAASASASATDEEPRAADSAPTGATESADPAPSSAIAAAEAQTGAAEGADPTPNATGFMGDLINAMRRVADDARESTLAGLRSEADQAVRDQEAEAERRRNDLRARAESDIAAVGEWAKAEAERIKGEAEQRVSTRRARLAEELEAEGSRARTGADAIRARVADYERRLQEYHEQLAAINDPASFAAAATRRPPPPALDGSQPAPSATADATSASEAAAPAEAVRPGTRTDAEQPTAGTNGSVPVSPVADADGQGMPATDLDELRPTSEAAPADESEMLAEALATEIVVKGLGSFGAITGFRQQLAAVDGIDAVGLSLGTSGEFVFRATHRPSLDMAAAITTLEGEATEVEPRAEGGLRVTLGRPR